jgi:PAS domain S-box-containing protein
MSSIAGSDVDVAATEDISILHVDDDPGFSAATQERLEREHDGLTVHTETSASDGLDRLASERIDCIVSGYDMSRMDGLEFLEAVRQTDDEVPFVLLTDEGDERVASEAISAGVTEYLQKKEVTDRAAVLADRIETVVERYVTERTEHERRFRQVTENISEVVWMSDVDKDEMLYVNPAYEEVWGRSRESLYEDPESFVDAIHPEDRERVVAALSEQTDGNYDEEYRVVRPDGETRWIRDSAVPVRDADGEVNRIVGIAEDITEQRKREEELKGHSEAIEAASDGIAILDDEATYQFVNQAHAEMYGYEAAEGLLGETWRACYGDEEADRLERTALPALTDEGSWRGEAIGRRVDGTRFPEELSLTRIDDGRIVCVVRDITDRKRREQEKKRRQDLLGHTEALADTGGWELDAETRALRWTDGTRRIFDVSEEYEPTLPDAIELYHPEDRETAEAAMDRALQEGDSFDLTLRVRTTAGRDRWVRAVGEPVVVDGEVTKVRGAIRDVTEQQRREATLERQNDRLEAFAGIVSHDLRNPLNVADGRLSLARDECDSDHLDSVADALDRMAAIIDDTMTLAQQGDTVGEMETVDLSALAAECWTGVVTDEATIEIVDDVTLRGDRNRVRHVLENLFRNAVEHGSTGSRTQSGDSVEPVAVRVGALPDGFYVEDDGPGVPDAERDRIFDPGYSTGTDDTGFGLAIVGEIVEAHGWSIDVAESDEGGARFEVTGVEAGT